ncbi:hypothetical protein MY11210_007352 [Beauveria gryllotalpidicola]
MAAPHPAAWPGDDSFGPRLPGHRDLTLVFENVVLAMVPAAMALLLTPLCLRRPKISKGYYRQLCHRVSALLRGILVSAIFERSLRLDCDVLSRNEAFKIMDTDLVTIEAMPEQFCNLCISFLEVGFGTYLLFSYVGL